MTVNCTLEVLEQWILAPLPAAPAGERGRGQVLQVAAGRRPASLGTLNETVPPVVLSRQLASPCVISPSTCQDYHSGPCACVK